MNSKDLNLEIGTGSYRDITGYYFGKWFDEPFTVDVLNKTKYKDLKYELCSTEEDQQHKDYKFIGIDKQLYFVDSKTHAHNYTYVIDGKKYYTDMLAIGQYAISSLYTDYLSFVHRGFIYIFPLNTLKYRIKPISVRESLGQNKSSQMLYMFDCYDIIDDIYTKRATIPYEMMDCYDEAYDLYTEYKHKIKKITNKKIGIDKELANQYMKEFAMRLKPIIDRFNNIYIDQKSIDCDRNLEEILELLS